MSTWSDAYRVCDACGEATFNDGSECTHCTERKKEVMSDFVGAMQNLQRAKLKALLTQTKRKG